MNSSFKIKRGESIIYIVLWMIILLMPVFIARTDEGIKWSRVQQEWIRFLPFVFVFLFHNYLLFPRFFLRKKRILYFALSIVLVLIAGYFADFVGNMFRQPPSMGLPPMEPHGLNEPFGKPPMDMGMMKEPPGGKPWHRDIFNYSLVSVLVVGFNAAIKLTVKWQDEEQKNKELEKEKLHTELALLKNQVSPHFFMNTLNNIHALIDIDSEDAKESLIKLSKLMRYLLYDSDEGKTTLKKEIEFIVSYVDLMKLRFTSQVSIQLSFPESIPNIIIHPMLFTSLVENAFKHGVSYQQKSFIEIILKTDKNHLYFRIRNSKQPKNNGINEPGGLGMENLKKRLDILYEENYTLEKFEDDKTFEINIKLPINDQD
ncbi:histidine kinase [uncultured Draconibacterium sp.]|uniref:sensor histidine kinase n=1 Tax=uncultured Draconibacterium sp. TaxID=1573823 RepID=UPI0032177AB2